jgi:hypothetical protein
MILVLRELHLLGAPGLSCRLASWVILKSIITIPTNEQHTKFASPSLILSHCCLLPLVGYRTYNSVLSVFLCGFTASLLPRLSLVVRNS